MHKKKHKLPPDAQLGGRRRERGHLVRPVVTPILLLRVLLVVAGAGVALLITSLVPPLLRRRLLPKLMVDKLRLAKLRPAERKAQLLRVVLVRPPPLRVRDGLQRLRRKFGHKPLPRTPVGVVVFVQIVVRRFRVVLLAVVQQTLPELSLSTVPSVLVLQVTFRNLCFVVNA